MVHTAEHWGCQSGCNQQQLHTCIPLAYGCWGELGRCMRHVKVPAQRSLEWDNIWQVWSLFSHTAILLLQWDVKCTNRGGQWLVADVEGGSYKEEVSCYDSTRQNHCNKDNSTNYTTCQQYKPNDICHWGVYLVSSPCMWERETVLLSEPCQP